MPVVPAIGVIASLWLISYLHWETWVRFAVWFLIGLVVYFAYSKRHSLLAPDSPPGTGTTRPSIRIRVWPAPGDRARGGSFVLRPSPAAPPRTKGQMMPQLDDKRVAFLATDGFEDSELVSPPWEAVTSAGATATMVAPRGTEITGKHGHVQPVDRNAADASADDFDAWCFRAASSTRTTSASMRPRSRSPARSSSSTSPSG